MRYYILAIFIGLSFSMPVHAGEPPTAPILSIETGMHTSVIRRIDIDRSGRWLVTASHDKTVRIWDLKAGTRESSEPVRIIRPPIGVGEEGKLNAVAISPDGNLVATGGWTQFNDGQNTTINEFTIYIFSRHDGRLLGQASGLPNVIFHLAFSPDGQYLAATFFGNNGVRLFAVDASGGVRLIAQDTEYGSDSYGTHFSPDGTRLLTACMDGYLRVYESGSWSRHQKYQPEGKVEIIKPIIKRKAAGGGQPYLVKFSPDGAKIAVGFHDTTKVNILSARDLSLLYAPDSGGVTDGNFYGLAWSSDGKWLYAGGMALINNQRGYIRRWSDAGRGGYLDIKSGSSNTIMDMAGMPDGEVAFGAYDPFIGILPGADAGLSVRPPLRIPPGVADYRDNRSGLQLSADAAIVKFGYQLFGKEPAAFSLASRSLTLAPGPLTLTVPDTSSLSIYGWKYTTNPTLNNQPLKLDQYETSRSLAIAPDKGSFLLGSEWSLRRFDKNGSEQWKVAVPGIAWAVNIAQNATIAVAAFADGTIRWYRYSDGKELVAFFPHADKKRWVLWTPSGYYDASSGGEELVGWHINNGKAAAADFFPASKFRSAYYRPDVISKVLSTLDEGEAVRLANTEAGRRQSASTQAQLLPPVVSILDPENGATVSSKTVTIRYTIRAPQDAPVTGLRVLVDGRPVATERGLKAAPKDMPKGTPGQSVTITIPERDCEVSVIAENRHSASVPATVRLSWIGKKQKEFSVQPKLYVLSVGVSAYRDKDLTLKFAAKDARDFGAAVQKQKGGLYRDVSVKILADAQATKDDILDGLDWLKKEVTSRDVGMIFIAGHGVNDSTGNYYYLPQNADPEKLMRTGVTFSDIKNTLASLAGKAVLFVDTCHSGNVMGTRRGVADINAVVNELASSENGAVVFASSTGRQYSLEDAKWGNGAFTKALVEGISGKADYGGKGKITINMLDLYLSERVKELTKGQQTPTTTKPQTIQDFPIAVRR